MVDSAARLFICRIWLRRRWAFLVCGWMQPYDCVFRTSWYLVQTKDSRSPYLSGGRADPLRYYDPLIWSFIQVHSWCSFHSKVERPTSFSWSYVWSIISSHVPICFSVLRPWSLRCISPTQTDAISLWANEWRSGMHIIAATFLLPVGVTVYTFVGGIKAT